MILKKTSNEASLNQEALLKIMQEIYQKGESQNNISPKELIDDVATKLQMLLAK